MAQFGLAWCLTVGSETAVLVALATQPLSPPPSILPLSRYLSAGLWVSSVTLPYLWFVAPEMLPHPTSLLLWGELAVWLVELCFLKSYLPTSWGRAAVYSGLCNAVSLSLGLALW